MRLLRKILLVVLYMNKKNNTIANITQAAGAIFLMTTESIINGSADDRIVTINMPTGTYHFVMKKHQIKNTMNAISPIQPHEPM